MSESFEFTCEVWVEARITKRKYEYYVVQGTKGANESMQGCKNEGRVGKKFCYNTNSICISSSLGRCVIRYMMLLHWTFYAI